MTEIPGPSDKDRVSSSSTEYWQDLNKRASQELSPERQIQILDDTINVLQKMRQEAQQPGAQPINADHLLTQIQTIVWANTLFSDPSQLLRWNSEGPKMAGNPDLPPRILGTAISENRGNK